MDQEPEVIRQQIDQTRSALTEKLETRENQVRDTVTNAKTTVEETIGSVKSTVHETVATVKRTFDLPYQVERHPWGMFGGSILVGYLVGTLWPGRPAGRRALGPSDKVFGDGPLPGGVMAARHEGNILAAGCGHRS